MNISDKNNKVLKIVGIIIAIYTIVDLTFWILPDNLFTAIAPIFIFGILVLINAYTLAKKEESC